jgi:hypothetical protein
MFKRLFLSIVALSALPLFTTEASATTCLSWRNIGGSNCCTRWSTKGILAEVTFNQDCPGGEGCTTNISAQSSNNIAFCENPLNLTGPPIKTTCTETVTFSGVGNPCSVQPASCSGQGQLCPKGKADCCAGLNCVDNSATDHTKVCRAFGTGGQPGQSCTSTTEIMPPTGDCQTACNTAGLGNVVDVVPVVMDTQVNLTAPVVGDCTPTPPTAQFECPSCSSTCVIQQHCTIDPKKIAYLAIREYQCTVTSVSGGGG